MTENKPHLLIVDDDVDIQEFLRAVLEPAGYALTAFASAPEALLFLRENTNVDLIVSDVRMPGMDGFEFIKAVQESGLEIPIICITAYGSVEAAVTAIRNGAHDYIVKPFKKDELLISVEGALKYKHLTHENK